MTLLRPLLLLLPLPLVAQTELSLEPPVFSDTFLLDLSSDFSEGVFTGLLRNEGDSTVLLRWQLLATDVGCPESWQFQFCDENFCGPSNVTSNINPGSEPNIPLEIDPGKLSTFDLHVKPVGSPGCCQPRVVVTPADDFEEVLLTAEYEVCVEGLTAVQPGRAATKTILFPNPAAGHFSFAGNPTAHRLTLTNPLGRRVREFTVGPSRQFDLDGLPAGLYLVSFFDQKNKLQQTLRLVKTAPTP